MNKVILVGRITKDPELKTISNSSSVVNFTIAVNRPVAQNADQNQNNADFINCVIWNKQAENLAKYVKQGSLIGVEGRIQTRNYESNGTTRYVTEVLCDNVQCNKNRYSNSKRHAGRYQPGKEFQFGHFNLPYKKSIPEPVLYHIFLNLKNTLFYTFFATTTIRPFFCEYSQVDNVIYLS